MSTVTEGNPRLLALTEAGVSLWLDQIRRSVVASDELVRMVTRERVTGVTSNPSMKFTEAHRRLLAGIEKRRNR